MSELFTQRLFFDFDLATFRMVVGIVAAIVSFIAHPLYIWAVVVKKETKPHFFTWLISSMISGVSLFLFSKADGGDPVYMLVGDFVGLTIIAVVSIFWGNGKEKDSWDWTCLVGAIVGVVVYMVYKNAFVAFVAVLCAEAIGLIPTIRKTNENPEQEDFVAWAFTCAGNVLNLFAVNWLNATDMVYVLVVLVMDGIVFSLILRGKMMKK